MDVPIESVHQIGRKSDLERALPIRRSLHGFRICSLPTPSKPKLLCLGWSFRREGWWVPQQSRCDERLSILSIQYWSRVLRTFGNQFLYSWKGYRYFDRVHWWVVENQVSRTRGGESSRDHLADFLLLFFPFPFSFFQSSTLLFCWLLPSGSSTATDKHSRLVGNFSRALVNLLKSPLRLRLYLWLWAM